MTSEGSAAAGTRKPLSVRREEILTAAGVEFARVGLAGARLDAIADRAGISHPRIVQIFGSKQQLFLEVVGAAFDRVARLFAEAADAAGEAGDPAQASPSLVSLGEAYRRLLQRDPTVALLMLQSYAACGDDDVRSVVAERHRDLQRTAGSLTGADDLQVRTFFATGLVVTISAALHLAEDRVDTAWSGWLLRLVDPAHGDEER